MKEKIASIILMFFVMALLPFAAAKCNSADTATTALSTSDATAKHNNHNDFEKLCALTAAQYKETYSNETIKALAIIMNTNLKVSPKKYTENDYLYKENASGSMLEVYSDIEKIVNSVKEKTLCKNNKAFYIPFSESSNGCTYQSDEFDYLQPVASPWDCLSKEFDKNQKCVGVSISGVDYLCQNGETAESALEWYLPEFEITQ